MENLTQLAQEGSIKAIKQILNQQLKTTGVNTKVTLGSGGTLEIVCEAGHPENLDKRLIVTKIKESLDHLSPRPFQRAHIRSSLTNDVQSLWVSSLNCDDRNKLLWSEKFSIRRLSWVRHKLRRWGIHLPETKWHSTQKKFGKRRATLKSSASSKVTYRASLVAGAIAAGACGWFIHDWWRLKELVTQTQQNTLPPAQTESVSGTPEPFAEGVRLAIQAATDGQSATTYREWVALANQWQEASTLMEQVSVNHPRYTEAQERVLSYRQNSEFALAQANALAPDSPP